ncbi:MAG TPA: hypothetical protein ENH92_00705 [Ectothiorhodospiraceae bacterium]|nr:hypothetical protein [Ectothiorhodospiraceae bacterium]
MDPTNWEWADDPAYQNLVRSPVLSSVPGTALYDVDCQTLDKNIDETSNKACRIRNGDPEVGVPFAPDAGTANRRIIYVAMLNCKALGITGNTPDIYVSPSAGEFAKFFLTEHAYPAPDVDFYAEYLGKVEEEDELRQIRNYNPIQLYE